VSQALYAAFTRSKLDPSFFAAPGQDAMRAEELAQKKQHNDFLKDQLRLKYQAKGESLDPEDDNAGSPQSNLAQSAVLGSETLKPIVERMGGEAAIRKLSKNQIQKIFPAKQFSPLLTGEYRENNKIPVEQEKQGGRVELLDKKQGYDAGKTKYVTEHADQRAADTRAAAESHFQQGMDLKKDGMAFAVSQKLPKDAKMVYDAGGRIDALIGKLGGPDNLDGIGLIEGSIPNPLFPQRDVIALRQEINNLVNGYTHGYFGSALSESEKKRADAAVPMISGWRSEAEVLHGVKLLRSALQSSTDQAMGAASPEIKRRMFDYYSQGGGANLFGGPQEGATAPSVSPSFKPPEAPPLGTTSEIKEPPSQDTLNAMANGPPTTLVRKPRPAAPAPVKAPGQMSPNTGAAYVKSVVKNGKRYFIDAKNKIVDAIQEATGGQ
jgi:hypothetical protein